MDHAPSAVSPEHGELMRLDHLGVIAVSGPDAQIFLHAQLTQDVLELPLEVARMAGYCSAKGRLLALFLMWRTKDAIRIIVPRELTQGLVKRLSMFVLRAKVKIEDVSEAHSMYGLYGRAGNLAFLHETFGWEVPTAPYRCIETGPDSLVALPDAAGSSRWLAVLENTSAPRFEAALSEFSERSAAHWRWLAIRSGEPSIVSTTQDLFVPQMVNLEVLDGVSFSKGCYPGQEVVARSQYLAKLRRRMGLFSAAIDAPSTAGIEIYSSDRPGEAAGTVVASERAPAGGVDLLAVLPVEAFGAGTLHLGEPEGPELIGQDLPYSLPANEVFVRPRL